MRLILGSNSPRRREILSFFSLPFEQISPSFDEDAAPVLEDPKDYALSLATGKAKSLAGLYPDGTILTADTVVFRDGKYYGKPLNEKDAFNTLKELEDKSHEVVTALCLYHQGALYSEAEMTKVFFNPLSDAHIRRYIKALHWADKAGGYAIQLAGSLIVRRIEGCYYNVVGLPVHTLSSLLSRIGIDLWDHLK